MQVTDLTRSLQCKHERLMTAAQKHVNLYTLPVYSMQCSKCSLCAYTLQKKEMHVGSE